MDRRTLAAYQPLLAAWASHVHVVPVRRIRQKAHVGPPHPRPAPHHPALRRDARRSTVRVIRAIAQSTQPQPPQPRARAWAPRPCLATWGAPRLGLDPARVSPNLDSLARAGLMGRMLGGACGTQRWRGVSARL